MSTDLESEDVSTGADRGSFTECVLAYLHRWYATIIEALAAAKEKAEINDDHRPKPREHARELRKTFAQPAIADDLEAWKYRVSKVPDEELLAFRDADYLGLRSVRSNAASDFWNARISVVEDEIRRRGLNA